MPRRREREREERERGNSFFVLVSNNHFEYEILGKSELGLAISNLTLDCQSYTGQFFA